jgi:hypothetical protein
MGANCPLIAYVDCMADLLLSCGVGADIVSNRQQTFPCRDKRDNRRASG